MVSCSRVSLSHVSVWRCRVPDCFVPIAARRLSTQEPPSLLGRLMTSSSSSSRLEPRQQTRERWKSDLDTFRCCCWRDLLTLTLLHMFQFLVDCVRLSSLPRVTFVLGGTEYSLTAQHYIRKVNPFSPPVQDVGWQTLALSLNGMFFYLRQ